MTADPHGPSITERLWSLANGPSAPAGRQNVALHLLDWLGCALAGRVGGVGRAFSSVAAPAGNPFALKGPDGAFAMGGLGSLLEMDDVHRAALLHPGPVVIPAVLSVAHGATPDALLDAIAAGYSAMIRLGRSVGPGHYALFHNTGTCGALGAAVGAARAMGFGPEAATSAMGHAMSATGGLWQARNEPVATKHLHVAWAARRGVEAALLAEAGLPGPRFILEGPQGFFKAMAPDGHPERILADPGRDLLAEVSFKPWPACRHAHPAIDAALSLRGAIGGHRVAGVGIETYADAVTFCDKPEPKTEGEARFSLQHAVAVTLLRGPPELADFAPGALGLPTVAALRSRVTVAADPAFSARYPRHFGARVTVTSTDGDTREAEVADAWGDPENPMDEAAVRAKFATLASAAGLPDADAASLTSCVLDLATGRPVNDLIKALATLSF